MILWEEGILIICCKISISRRADDPNKSLSLLHLIRLFKFSRCSGKEMNALIKLLTACIDYKENNAVNMQSYLIESAYFEPLWRLYFDPLLIETATSSDTHVIIVKWTDGREDKCNDGRVDERERLDYLVHRALSACNGKEQLMSLLVSIQTSSFKAIHIFSAWQRLYRHVKTFSYFDLEISEYLFDRLQDVDMTGYENELYQFIDDHLLDIWSSLTDERLLESVRHHIVQLVQILLNHKTKDSNQLLEQLTERICSNTRSHPCFYLLLHELLSHYDRVGLTTAIKKIDQNTLTRYLKFITDNNHMAHRSFLMSILKYVSMFTEYDLLRKWFDLFMIDPHNEIYFQLIQHSLCPTTTLSTYVQHATETQIEQILHCIQLDLAKQYIPILLTILESLSKNIRTQKYLFRSDHLHRIIQLWLTTITPSSIIIRLTELSLDIGYSKYNTHALDIAQFFLGEYASTLISTYFEDQSPLAHIILFLSSVSKTSETSLHSTPEQLIKFLFQSVDGAIDDDSSPCSSHLHSLSVEILKPQSRTTLIQLLSAFIPDIMGLLGRTGQMKKAAIILLAELLDLSADERSILRENIQSEPTRDVIKELPTNTQQQTLFFSTEQSNISDVVRVRYEDFLNGREFLTSLHNVQPNKIDQILRSHLSDKRSVVPSTTNQEQQNRLVLTDTARENVSKILEVLDDPIPILLEGNTGVGKSASVMEAAHQSGRTLVRYNMSSRVTIDDLLGKVTLLFDEESQTTRLQFVNGPFTEAFSRGYWILFDELNLAQDTVLQAIESALDTHRLTIHNSSSSEQSMVEHRMHSNFRLFATQNPNTGFFKGKREKLSPSFLSRFRALIFNELPDSEWHVIVQERLAPHMPGQAGALAELLVLNFNSNIKKMLNDPAQPFPEIGPYAEISIRELLKWVELLICWQKENPSWLLDLTARIAQLSFSAWCVYGARYRAAGRTCIENILTDNGTVGWGHPSLHSVKMSIDHNQNHIYFDNVRYQTRIEFDTDDLKKEWISTCQTANLQIVASNPDLLDLAFRVHMTIHKTLMNDEFIRLHGIYRIDRSWLWEWLISTTRSDLLRERKQFALHGCKMYQNRFRHRQAQETIRTCFNEIFNNSDLIPRTSDDAFVRPEMPYVLTDRVLSTLKQVCFNMNIKQPILITGAEGCGKSELFLTLAWFCGQRVHQLNITPETEPSALIGQVIPNDTKDEHDSNSRKKLIWQNGCVTDAFTSGQWVLLDNLNTAESSVLERLNPVLEQKPMLILTEKGDVKEQSIHNNYQLVATMTPPDFHHQSQVNSAKELSPSLYNRFSIIHMQDFSFDIINDSQELLLITKAILSDEPTIDYKLVIEVCQTILRFYSSNTKNFPKFTFRNIIRLLDSTYLLQLRFSSTVDFLSSLWTAFHVTIANQIKSEQLRNELTERIKSLLEEGRPLIKLVQPNFTDCIDQSNEHILTQSRLNYANAVLGAVTCHIPLLLEGPAGVGKTALISYLCKHMKSQTLQLERVNNTDTTTIQDYLGIFLPVNDGFAYQKGALYRAMENGWWFLADEFNLADPSVMNMLFPLLEGKNIITIPSTGKTIIAKSGFQFFATQNDASYANRYQLPVSLRNRFLEIQFNEFPLNELAEIIQKRHEIGKEKPSCLTDESSVQLDDFYHRVLHTRSRITFRELVKWLHRHALFSSRRELWPIIGNSLLGAKYPLDSTIREQLVGHLQSIWPKILMSSNSQIEIKKIDDGKVRFREGELLIDLPNITLNDTVIPTSPETFHRSLVRLALAIHAKEPVLLVGPTSCKTLLVETWARLSNRSDELIKVHLTPDTEANDLIGEIQPFSFLDLLKRLPVMAERVCFRFQSLCRHRSKIGQITTEDQIFLRPLHDAITNQLPHAIRQFEDAYSRAEQRRQQTDELHDDFAALRAQAESILMPTSSEEILLDRDIDTKSDDYHNTSIERIYYDFTYEMFDQMIPALELNISNEGFVYEYDDGLDLFTYVNQSDIVSNEINEDSIDQSQTSLLDDGYPVIMNTNTTLPNSVDEIEYPETLRIVIEKIRNYFGKMLQDNSYAPFTSKDATLIDYQSKFNHVWDRLTATNIDRTKPIFQFNDGPVTMAAKRGGILFLEDLDLPSQAVTERLNSMLEPSPTFALTEDITSHVGQGQLNITLSSHFQIFASVHQEQTHQTLKLSPAIRSRFTEIYIPPYTESDLRILIESELIKHKISAKEVDTLVQLMFSLRRKLHEDSQWKITNDIQLLFRWTDFLTSHHSSVPLLKRLILGARFFYFDQLSSSRHAFLFDEWRRSLPKSENFHEYEQIFALPTPTHGAMTMESIRSQNTDEKFIFPFEIGQGYVALRYTGVRYSSEHIDEQNHATHLNELHQRLDCVPTPTFLNQIARIFAATSSNTPLLLEGPPGIGKTRVVTQVCTLLNQQCERINFSANTSLDQLIGCIIPRFVNGLRIFQWQEGRILSAIKAHKWILFDELNLAATEVLEGLTPLFYRSITHFTVPMTGEIVDMKDIRLFATMNPSTMIDGRSQLPRSIRNLFTIIQLDEYSEIELRLIFNRLFAYDLQEKNITMEQLDALFDMHTSLKVLVRQGQLGRTGGPYELNLRDLTKFRDVFRGSIDSQLFHYQYINTTDDETDQKGIGELCQRMTTSDARSLSIRKFAQVVYACQFEGQDDFLQACELINTKFPINSTLSTRETDCSIDTSIATVVRIGSIYIGTGNEEPSPIDSGLIHTKKTIRQLELLATACQSKRTILLQGDICSRKSSLVMELARLTCHRLIIIPLHENFETADLIGSWRANTNQEEKHPLFKQIDRIFQQIIKMFFLNLQPILSRENNKYIFQNLKLLLSKRTQYEIDALQGLVTLLTTLTKISQIPNQIQVFISCYARQADYYLQKFQQIRLNENQEIGFVFIESEFVEAIREGWWVLLDNINSAPSEVLERLNSLTEDNPMLSLYENSKEQILSQSNGIHPNFRLFTTANVNRIYSNKLSAGFLNRVIRICLPSMDEWNSKNDSDLHELVSSQLATISAGRQLANLMVSMHFNVQQFVRDGHLTYPSDFLVTYRLLQQCVQTFRYLVDQQINPVDACYWSLLRSYCSALKNPLEYQFFLDELQKTVNELNLGSSSTFYSNDSKQITYLEESQSIHSYMIQFERIFLELILTLIHFLVQEEKNVTCTRDLLIVFLDEILFLMTPTNAQLIQLKQILIHENPTDAKFLVDFLQHQQIPLRSDLHILRSESASFRALCQQLSERLDHFIRNTSFCDTRARSTFLQRIFSIVEIFDRFLNSENWLGLHPDMQIIRTSDLRPILTLREKSLVSELFHDQRYLDAKERFLQHMFEHFDHSLIWSFERIQKSPIRVSRKDIRKLVEHLLNDQSKVDLLQPIQYFATLLEWIGLRWIFDEYLTTNVRQILQGNLSITQDFLLECEVTFSSWQICKQVTMMIDEMLGEFPSESSTLNVDYLRLKKELTEKEIQLNKCKDVPEYQIISVKKSELESA